MAVEIKEFTLYSDHAKPDQHIVIQPLDRGVKVIGYPNTKDEAISLAAQKSGRHVQVIHIVKRKQLGEDGEGI